MQGHHMRPITAGLKAGTAVVALAWAVTAHAQDQAAETPSSEQGAPEGQSTAPRAAAAGPVTIGADSQVGGNIVVTGSRIRGAAPVGSSVIAVDRTAIESSGAVTTDRLIKEIPQVFDLGTSENSRGQSGGSSNITYGNAINIRGIGPYATLTLVDGHRAIDNSRSVDPSIIPTLGLERVEVIADGASAVYGSDAVAGVVNLIPRRDLDGVEALVRSGFADNFHQEQLGVAAGKTGDWGQVMIAYEHVFRSNLSGDDRDFFTSDQRPFGGPDYRTTLCSPGNLVVDGASYAIPQGGVTPATAGSLRPDTVNRCEGFRGQDLFPETSYDSVNATATAHLTDWLDFYGDGYWSKRRFSRFGGYEDGTFVVPESNAFFVRPPGTTGPETVELQLSDLGNNVSEGYTRTWEATGGLRATFGDWQISGQISYGRGHDESDSYHGIDNAAMAAALASSDPATAFDPYGLSRTSAATLVDVNDNISLAPTLTRLTDAQATISGTLFHLPGGGVKLAAGYERLENEVSLGLARGAPDTPVTYRDYDRQVDSAYAELFVPIFGTANAQPGLQRLELSAAVRYDDYSDVGSTTNPKFGVNWSPVTGVVLRGSYGQSFRAPLFSQIYGNSSALYVQPYSDPTQGGAVIRGVALSGGNPDLAPETAETWSVGVDLDLFDGARLSLTYWNVDYAGQVTTYLADLGVLAKEDALAGTGVILRGQAAADRVAELMAEGKPVRGVLPTPVTLFVDGRTQNLGRSLTSGIDVIGSYTIDTATAGTFILNANATYITRYKVAVSNGAEPENMLNTIFNPLRFKGRAFLTWSLDDITARIGANHVGGYDNNTLPAGAVQKVHSYTTVDLGVTFNIGDPASSGLLDGGFSLGLDVLNLFDTDPPYVNFAPTVNGSGGYDATAANPIGREIAVTVRKRF
ncbi:MAG TPA: TonB-dependent receptor [Sphingomonas sp.]|nr:TonB-dependent receptor [Sphingomonas sp.]